MKIPVKHCLKHCAGIISAALAGWTEEKRPHVAIFNYHRVAVTGIRDFSVDDWNVPPDVFERQIHFLAENAEVIALSDVLARAKMPSGRKPLAAISFDDAYANVVTNAVPVLRRYRVPATIFVVTAVVGHNGPMPFDRWSLRHAMKTPPEVTRPATWSELEECLDCGLIKLGGHSHRHLNGRTASNEQLAEEAQLCRETLHRQFGERFAPLYAYPYGCRRLGTATPAYAEVVRSAGFESAFTSDLGTVTANADPLFIPRIEAHPLDNALILRSKLRGALAGYWLTDHLRRENPSTRARPAS